MKYDDTHADWDTFSQSDAQQVLVSITTFEYIVVFLIVYQYLSHIAGITVKLQKCALDIIEAYEQITEVSKVYKDEQKNVDHGSLRYLTIALELLRKLGGLLKCHVSL